VVTEAVVLAGGLGTRLRGALPDLPKSMASVAGRPFLAYLLQFLEVGAVRRVVLALGYKSEAIRSFFGTQYGRIELAYSVEEEPLGTGGALQQSLHQVQGEFAFVLNGDTFFRIEYPRFADVLSSPQQPQLAVALRKVDDASRYGAVVVAGGRIQGFQARGIRGPGLINAGCYLLARNIFDRYPMPAKFSWESDFLEPRVAELQPIAFECDAPFIDIGVPESLAEAQTLVPEWMNTAA
jgi:D-glycero-alpha-D-manno-heptose 1-phosphate guanylyltransferase